MNLFSWGFEGEIDSKPAHKSLFKIGNYMSEKGYSGDKISAE